MLLSIITATYNRAYCLENIYTSLISNLYTDEIEWLIVDDGSTDTTRILVDKWLLEDKINLKYFKINNGGKTRAIYHGFSQNPIGQYTLILDSDDYFSDNALEIIKNNLIDLPERFIGIIGLKAYTDGKVIGQPFSKAEAGYTEIYFGKNAIKSDRLFIIKTAIYSDSIVLPFEGENFMPDNIPYINANRFGIYKLINEVFYLGDYLEDGMTSNIHKMAMTNIKSFVFEKSELQKQKLSLTYTISNTIKYIHYSILAKRKVNEIYKLSNDKFWTVILYLPTYLLLFQKRRVYLKFQTH